MQGGFQNPPVGDHGILTRPAIRSPGYTPGSTGWSINRDGTAELINVIIRQATIPDVWISGICYPTGLGYTVLGESFPRILASANYPFTNVTPRFTAIELAAGLTISRMTLITGNTAQIGGTHGWYALTDSAFKVLAATADQTSTFWNATHTPFTLPFTGSVTTAYRGVYYVFASVSGNTEPAFVGLPAPISGAATAAPILGGTGSATQPLPAVGSTLGSLSTVSPVGLYACVG